MKGVILAGGQGTRLRPLTYITNKHLLPIGRKQMILYPLETLKQLGCTDIMLITGGEHIGHFSELLGDGSEYGVNLTYRVQKEAGGIAQALALAEDFVDDKFWVILGDNLFEDKIANLKYAGTRIFLKKVDKPERFGVMNQETCRIEEKPVIAPSNWAVTGLYMYSKGIFDFIKNLKPSGRGELEITDVNNWCLSNPDKVGPVSVEELDGFWSDCGTFESIQACNEWIYGKVL